MSQDLIDVSPYQESSEAEATAKLYSCIVSLYSHTKHLKKLGATGTAVVTSGEITSIDITSRGNPAGIPTTVVITGGGGSGDDGTMVITGW